MFDFSVLTTWIDNLLRSFMPDWLTVVTECVLIGFLLLLTYSVLALFYIYFERKVCAAFQCRLGPNRVGPWGLLQSVADMFKILIKELISLKYTDKFLFALAPYLVILASMLAFAVLPWGNGLQIINFNIGIFFLIAVSVFFSPAGQVTISLLLSALSVQARRWSATSCQSVCRC